MNILIGLKREHIRAYTAPVTFAMHIENNRCRIDFFLDIFSGQFLCDEFQSYYLYKRDNSCLMYMVDTLSKSLPWSNEKRLKIEQKYLAPNESEC